MGMQKLFIGIDGGGTSTRALLATAEGVLLGRGVAGSSNYNHAGRSGAREALEKSVAGAFARAGMPRRPVDGLFLGLAGVTSELDRSVILDLARELDLAPPSLTRVNHDIHIALAGGLAGAPGIALIAGTGASCYGLDGAGCSWQCGGWGSVADDFGSASWLGQRAIQIAVRQADGRIPGGEPMRTVFHFLGISQVEDILHRLHVDGLERHEMARLAPLLGSLCASGCEPVVDLFREAAASLAELVAVTARELRLAHPKVVLAGGLATSGAPFQPLLEDAIRRAVPGAEITIPVLDPASGAVLEALKAGGLTVTPAHIALLKETRPHET